MKAHLIFILIGMFLITTSCEDDDHEHDEEHTDADGFVLEDENGSEVYREFEGAIEGSVSLSVGDTLVLSVHFLDHDGNEIEHEEDELVVSENDANIAIVEVEEHEEEHHGAGLHVIGVSAGSTNFKLQLMHDGHADYTSTNNVPVVVN
jgi:activator of 2-hydroxyglutaryl-CoA dehydratase